MTIALYRQVSLIDGKTTEAEEDLGENLADANTGAILTRQLGTDAKSVGRAIAAAERVHDDGEWANAGVSGRRPYLSALATELSERAELIATADAVSTGVPISVTRLVAGSLAGTMTGALNVIERMSGDRDTAGRRVRIDRVARGPAAVLVPWNAPLGIAAGKIAYALGTGCPVIVKAPEWAPFSCSIFADAVQAAELPSGVFQLVHGGPSVGQRLVSDPALRVVSFTGSTETGRQIASVAAGRLATIHLELSGNNAAIVMDDADLGETARHLVSGFTKLNGQWCEAPRRVYIRATLRDGLIGALTEELSRLQIGSSLDARTTMGPLSNRRHLDNVTRRVAQLQESGARALAVGRVPDEGNFMAPTVVWDVAHDPGATEIFGPVLKIHTVPDIDHAITYANDTPYGLAAYVFGKNIDQGMDVAGALRAGEVKVNGSSLLNLADGVEQDFFGASGLGSHGDESNVRLFAGARTRGVDDPLWPL